MRFILVNCSVVIAPDQHILHCNTQAYISNEIKYPVLINTFTSNLRCQFSWEINRMLHLQIFNIQLLLFPALTIFRN